MRAPSARNPSRAAMLSSSWLAIGIPAARAAAAAQGRPATAGAVTVSLVLDFMASATIGQWLEFRPVVLRHGRTLAFTECHVLADGELAARASATFRLG